MALSALLGKVSLGMLDEAAWKATEKLLGKILSEKGPKAAEEVVRRVHERQELVKQWRPLSQGLMRVDLAHLDVAASDALIANHANRLDWRNSAGRYTRLSENRFHEAFAYEALDHLGKWEAKPDLENVREHFNLQHLLAIWRDVALEGQDAIDRHVEGIINDYWVQLFTHYGLDVPASAVKKADNAAAGLANSINTVADIIRQARP